MSKTHVVETRTRKDGAKRRVYERPDGTRYSTIEIPLDTWEALKKASRYSADSLLLIAQAKELRAQKVGLREIARRLNKPYATVQKWFREEPRSTMKVPFDIFSLGSTT